MSFRDGNDLPTSEASRYLVSGQGAEAAPARTVNRHSYRVVTLRPGTSCAFSTNYYHDTWHIVTSQQGAGLLARLLWGLSYQRRPGTLLLVHGDHLWPTPFEAERSDPFALVSVGLTRLDAADFRDLKSRLPNFGPSARTIRWHTFGLDAALRVNEDGARIDAEAEQLWRRDNQGIWSQERMERLEGFICYSAPPPILRRQALQIYALRVTPGQAYGDMDYHYLAEGRSRHSWVDGEVQIFADFADRVAAASEARQELLANPRQPILSESVQEAVSARRDQIKARRARNRRNG